MQQKGILLFETCMKFGNLQGKSNFNRNEVLLLMIENIKTIQIGKFCKGEIKCTKKFPELLFLYPFTQRGSGSPSFDWTRVLGDES